MIMQTIAVDSLAKATAVAVDPQIQALVTMGLGLLLKVVMDLGKLGSKHFAALPGFTKAVVALFLGPVFMLIAAKTGIKIDLNNLDITAVGLTVSGVAMGLNALLKSIGIKVKTPQEPTV